MVDHDIFRRTVSRAWRRAAREVFTPEFTEPEVVDRAISFILSAAADVLRRAGCPGLPNLLAMTASLRVDAERLSLIDVLDQIEAIEHGHLHDVTRVAGDVARRLGADAMTAGHQLCHLDDDDVVAEITIELAVCGVMLAPLPVHPPAHHRVVGSGPWRSAGRASQGSRKHR